MTKNVPAPVNFAIIDRASKFISFTVDKDVIFKPHTLYILTVGANAWTVIDKENNRHMRLFYKATRKEILEIRNRIIKDIGIPALERKGFKKSPFSTSWYGKDDLHGFTYYLCRLTRDSTLEDIEIQIARDDKWIKIIVNVFKLQPDLNSLDTLNGVDGLQYKLPPNSTTEMRLRSDDIEGPPIFRLGYSVGHKLKKFYTKGGLTRSIERLTRNIETDFNDIDRFIRRWHELHQPMTTNWTGHQISNDSNKR